MYIAIDLGGTKTLIAAYTDEGQIIRSEKHPTEKVFHKFLEKLPETIDKVANGEQIDGIAIAAPGLINYDNNEVKTFGHLDWKNVDIVTPLQEHYGQNVHIDNDGNMGALGEANMGAGAGYEKALYVTLSTGIGTGITYKGELSPTLKESEGGMMEFMHEGKLTRWEDFASGSAFVDEFGKFGADDDDPADWQKWSENVSLGMVGLISIIQPDVIVIGGSMGVHIHKYHDFLHSEIQKLRGVTVDMPVLVGAEHPEEAVINGCYIACKQRAQN